MQVRPLRVGPIVGEATSKYLRVLGRSEQSPSVGVMRLGEKPDLSDAETRFVKMDSDFDLTGVAIFSNLQPETTYYYQYGWIEADISTTPFLVEWANIPTYSVKTLSEDNSKPCSIVLGSCRYMLRLQVLGIGKPEEDQFEPVYRQQGDKTFEAIVNGHVNQNLVTHTIMCGDQVYADDLNEFFPAHQLDDFLIRYRVAFSQPYIRELMAKVPTFMTLDDHEIEDNWPASASSSDWNGKYQFALKAYQAYQASHSPLFPVNNNQLQLPETPTRYWYTYRDGCADFFVMDTRTERDIEQRRIISLVQMQDLKDWLRDGSGRVKCVVSAIPLFPNYLNGDDQWGQFINQRNEVIDFIANHKIQKVVFLSGDIHNSYTSILEGNGSKIIQVISSPLFWPWKIGTGDPDDYNLDGPLPGHEAYTITTPSEFIKGDNFTRVNISPTSLELAVYDQAEKLLDRNCLSFEPSSPENIARKLVLHSLSCYKNEDWIGKDECRLDIYIDGHLRKQLRQDMDEGDTWDLNETFYFNNTAKINLFDEDSPDPDDFLGQLRLRAKDGEIPHNSATYRFTEDKADYTLNYTVTNNDPTPPSD